MGEAKKLKVCLVLLTVVFMVYVGIFAEKEVVKLENEYQNYKLRKNMKSELRSNSIKAINLSSMEHL